MLAKKCTRCEILKQENEYHIQKGGLFGRKSVCKQCVLYKRTEDRRQSRTFIPSLEGEIWVDVYGFKGLYKVSNLGRIKSLDRYYFHKYQGLVLCKENRILSQSNFDGEGSYKKVQLCKTLKYKTFLVHRVVLMSFFPDVDFSKLETNHKNKIRYDNRLENLEWVTPRENSSHKVLFSGTKKSKYVSVTFNKKYSRWQSTFKLNGKAMFLGSYGSEIEAHNAYLEAIKKHGITNRYMVSK